MAKRTLTIDIVGSAAGAKKAFGDAEREADGFQSRMKSKLDGVGQSLTRTGAMATAGLTVPIVGALGAATKAAAEEEQEMALLEQALRKNTGATDAQVASLEKWITTQQNATGVADGELRPALAKLVIAGRTTAEAQSDLAVAMDISAARGKPLASIVEAMSRAAAGSTSALGKLGIATKDAAGETMTYEQILANAAKTMGGSAAKAAETNAGKAKILKAQWADLTEEVGAMLLPVLSKLTGWLTKVGNVVSKLTPTQKAFLMGAVALLAVIGPLTTAVGALATVVGFLLSPVGLVIAAVVAFAAVWVLAYKKIEPFRAAVDAYVRFLRDVAAPAIVNFGKSVIEAFEPVVAWVQENWPKISEAIGHVLNVVTLNVRIFIGVVMAIWKKWGDEIIAVVKFVWGIVQSVVVDNLKIIGAFISSALDIINGDWGDAWETMKGVASGIWQGIVDAARNGFNMLLRGLTAGVNAAIKIINKAISLFNKIPGVPDIPEVPLLEAPQLLSDDRGGNAGGMQAAPTSTDRGRRGGNTIIINAKGTDPREIPKRLRQLAPAVTG